MFFLSSRRVYGSRIGGMPYPGEVSEGTGYMRTYVKHSTLISAMEQELRDRRVEDRANATGSA